MDNNDRIKVELEFTNLSWELLNIISDTLGASVDDVISGFMYSAMKMNILPSDLKTDEIRSEFRLNVIKYLVDNGCIRR